MSYTSPLATVDDVHENRASVEVCRWISRYKRSNPGKLYTVSKRGLDIAFVVLASPIVILVVGLAALLIKLESPDGPVFHRQDRTGYRLKRFQVFKLRTMVPDAEARKAGLQHMNEREWPDFKITKDPRILATGRFFRRTSIDELPQLWNVLMGDMTLVGPRPTTLAAVAYEDWQLSRFVVRPGLTGLWQVTARNDPSFVLRTRLDLSYTMRRSCLLDLEILIRTAAAAIRGAGA